jgi:hypothetical protein
MSEITKTIRYEFEISLASLKRYDTWIFLSAIFSLIFILYKAFGFAIGMLVIVLILNGAKNYATGQVTEYFRKKYKQEIQNGLKV